MFIENKNQKYNFMHIVLLFLITTFQYSNAYALDAYPIGNVVSENYLTNNCIITVNPDDKRLNCEMKKPRCTLSINEIELKRAGFFFGSFFGHGKQNDYQFVLEGSTVGPLLSVRTQPIKPDGKTSTRFFAATSIYSTCDNLNFDFEQIDITNSITIHAPDRSIHKLTLRLNVFYSVPEEGEFRLPDLRGVVSSYSEQDLNEEIVLLRAMRYRIPENIGDQECSKSLMEMSKEICNLFFDVNLTNQLGVACDLGISGETEDRYSSLKKLKMDNKIIDKYFKGGVPNPNISCPAKN